jgi:hypothetical protein
MSKEDKEGKEGKETKVLMMRVLVMRVLTMRVLQRRSNKKGRNGPTTARIPGPITKPVLRRAYQTPGQLGSTSPSAATWQRPPGHPGPALKRRLEGGKAVRVSINASKRQQEGKQDKAGGLERGFES